MQHALQRRVFVGVAVLVGLTLAWQIAHERFLLPAVLLAALIPWLASQWCKTPTDAWVGGLVLAGYLIGNRGFAQVHVPNVSLLPGEAALALGACVLGWRCARQQHLPLLKDPLNLALVLWILIGVVRLRYDLRDHRFLALRDFALVYYAGFFFLGQAWVAIPEAKRWIDGAFTVGFAVGAPVFLAFIWWPGFFEQYTVLAGAPVIFVKSDVAGGFMVAGALWFAHRHVRSRRWTWLLLAGVCLVAVAFSNSRAAFLSLACVMVALLVGRDVAILRRFVVLGTVGGLLLFVAALAHGERWRESHLYRLVETGLSIGDFAGSRDYTLEQLSDKGDNNQFRLVWWRTVLDETLLQGPWLGLGFGYDLSRRFTDVYYGNDYDDLTARSPHNVLLTVTGRMGLVGALAFLGVLAAAALQYRRHRRAAGPGSEGSLRWVAAAAILVSACFGVVLEGPMGAVVFWTLLGMANGQGREPAAETMD